MTTPAGIKIRDIQRAVARFYGVSLIDMLSVRRDVATTRPRQIAIYLAKTLTTHSLPEIGRLFGHRDHTTVLHGFRKIDGLARANESLAVQLRELRAELCARNFTGWRLAHLPAAEAFDLALNKVGLELAIVPLGTRDRDGFAAPQPGVTS